MTAQTPSSTLNKRAAAGAIVAAVSVLGFIYGVDAVKVVSLLTGMGGFLTTMTAFDEATGKLTLQKLPLITADRTP